LQSAQVVRINNKEESANNQHIARRYDKQVGEIKNCRDYIRAMGMDLMGYDAVNFLEFEALIVHLTKAIKENQKMADKYRSPTK
jgi:hypothetical protein